MIVRSYLQLAPVRANRCSRQDQCEYVYNTCPTSDTFLSIPYLQTYFCASPTARPFVFLGFLLRFGFISSTLVYGASSFCPNLATVAQLLKISIWTNLALGSGSPDVFATFAVLRTNVAVLSRSEVRAQTKYIVFVVNGEVGT